MKRIITAIAAAALLISAGAPAATAADSRTGSKYCGAGYSVGLTSKTTSKGSHVHYYKSDAGQERTFQNGFTARWRPKASTEASTGGPQQRTDSSPR